MGVSCKNARGFLVDLDGTLYFQKPVRLGVFLAMLKYYAVHFREWRQLYGIYIFRKIREKEQFRTMTYDQQLAYASRHTGVRREELDRGIQHWMFQFPLRLIRQHRDEKLLAFLQEKQRSGKKLIVYSDYPVEEKLRSLGVEPDYIFYPGINGIAEMKPSPKAMRRILEAVGMDAEALVFIGDRADKDGKSAESVNMPFVPVHGAAAKRRGNNEKIY